MRIRLSELLTISAVNDPSVVVLSGDHGYALFDSLNKECPDQFINCGVAEQCMVGIAAGLAKKGFRPVVYGLASFIPIRVLEQIKLDICYSNLPVTFLGDGAGVVYSTLGASHHSAEDIAVLQPLPNIAIYSPCDALELEDCFTEALYSNHPSYIRLGKSDRPRVSEDLWRDTQPRYTHYSGKNKKTCIVATGSMVHPATEAARSHQVDCLSVPQIKPFPQSLTKFLNNKNLIIVLEEHSESGGLCASIRTHCQAKKIVSLSLKNKFADKCGSYQYALSEHEMDDASITKRIKSILEKP